MARSKTSPLVVESGALIDRSGRYRYSLWRLWKSDAPRLVFLMLNPSTADAERNDPTISTCIRIAQRLNYGSMEVVNLFALRATEPTDLKRARDPVGKRNDAHIIKACSNADALLLAWGNDGMLMQRNDAVVQLLTDIVQNKPVLCLGRTLKGQPRHPLYTRNDAPLTPFAFV